MPGQRVGHSRDEKHTKSSHVSAFGRGASVPGGWRPVGIYALVLNMKPLYVS